MTATIDDVLAGRARWCIAVGDALAQLREMPDASVHCIVTSPPYWGLRDYGVDGQIGLEKSPDEFIAKLVAVFAEARRVLRPDGTCWVNMGDSYANDGKWGGATGGKHAKGLAGGKGPGRAKRTTGLKPKDLVGIPWMLAFALRADGWWLRSDIIWSKPAPMPESITDRPTSAHEHVFLLSKSEIYAYDAAAIAEPSTRKKSGNAARRYRADAGGVASNVNRSHQGFAFPWEGETRNARNVWTIPTQAFPGAHFATMPEALARPCVLAGCPRDGVVLDPFAGAGTVGLVALAHGRRFVGVELNPGYAQMARDRIVDDAPLLNAVGARS